MDVTPFFMINIRIFIIGSVTYIATLVSLNKHYIKIDLNVIVLYLLRRFLLNKYGTCKDF